MRVGVGVVGLGAVGSIFFNRLLHHINPPGAKSAHRVFALVKPQHLPRLESVALYERGQPDAILRVPVHKPPNALALTTGADKHVTDPLDVVLIAVKSTDTLDVAQQLAASPLVGKNSLLISLQNGLGNVQTLRETLATENVLHGVTYMGGQCTSPGHVILGGHGSTILQGADHLSDLQQVHLDRLCQLLDAAQLHTTVINSQDVQSVIWTKLLVNAGINPLASILDRPNFCVTQGASNRRVVESVVNEVAAVAAAEGIPLHLDGKSPLTYTLDVASATATNVCSMLHDLRGHKRTEIGAINEMVVYYGQRHGIPTPTNQLLVHLVRGLETRAVP
ncbi:2-dehydropantoate 2-reductase [Saprolegnia parasitica CBS 223.65]|uniref:2-dehydropantoate 2-reductase n=1 Tax=Saprolegnia parasitica (strain CBS 223.65) TaxID=695850 RepID=A0A067C4C1_SAPPC|nr:2-dehydropantoate 2-reductase [Saprolegnia parasitica CBS 223.65]KDO25619.1 2-dehydropantoate 2-reductase [Saprolegnia parasitica CBS 223.65]|eukprot:XP_012203652.1 2-dehydropantoate 2-reductase [Saprolegnia parasitica CBS 223.65]